MEPRTIAKQAMDYHRAAVDNSFNAMLLLYEQTARMADSFLAQATVLPAEGTKVIHEWLSAYKKGCEALKSAADENFNTVEGFLAGTGKAETK